MKKTLAFGIVLLFIGVTFAPSLYADVESDNSTENSDIEITDISYKLWRVVATIKNNGLTDAWIEILFSVVCHFGGVPTLPIDIGYHIVKVPAGDTVKVTQLCWGIGRLTVIVETEGAYFSSEAFWLIFIGMKIR
jgi:hypothetical protein